MVDSVVLVGCGNMGFAMLKGWLDAGILQPGQVHVVEPTDDAHALGELVIGDVAAGAERRRLVGWPAGCGP